MKLSSIIKGICVLVAMTGAVTGYAQEWEEGGEIESVEIEIVKEKQISLPHAERNYEKIPPRPAAPLRPSMTYDFQPFTFTAPEFRQEVKPLRVKQEDLTRIYQGYASAGFGNYSSPYLEGSYTSKRDAKKFLGLEGYHKSYGKGPVGDELSASGDTRLNFFGKAMGPNFTTAAAFRYDNKFNHFYAPTGAPVETRIPSEIRQTYNIGAIDVSLENTKEADVNVKLNGTFSYLADRYHAEESKTAIFFESDYDMKRDRTLLFRTNYKLIARKDSLTEAKPRHLFTIAPAYRWKLGNSATLTAGLAAVVENDTIGPGSFHLYPDLWLTYPAGKNVETYAVLTGGFDEVSLHSLSAGNPWVGADIPIFHTNRALQFMVGARGTLAKIITFDAGADVTRFIDLFFYENMPDDRTKFTIAYDDATRLNFFLQGGMSLKQKGQLSFRGDYYSYATDNVAYPWHRPAYKLGVYSSWMLAGKVMADLNLITQGGAKAYDNELNTVVSLQPSLDVNARVRYFWSKRFSLFAEGTNLLNRKYPLYLHYQARGLQVTAGASLSF
jgi:hypothetical protein